MDKPDNPFDLQYLKILLERFVDQAPALLASVPQTAHLATKLEHLSEIADLPFTIAIVGQMRSGKSSLINALIGQDLAPVGVNETTATINYFRYAPPEHSATFKVHWREKPPEEFPISDMKNWCGQNDLAGQTRFIEFYTPAEILKTLYIVDTPGTRSVIADHTQHLNDFMAEKRERETLACGGKADAIIYLVGPVARDTDKTFLDQFADQTRLTGSSPFNSIAVLHKWETVDSNDPTETALGKAEIISQQLADYVSAVIPASAPLMQVADRLSSEFWGRLASLIRSTPQRMLERAVTLGSESRLEQKIPELFSVYQDSALPWASFRAIICLAINNGLPDGDSLQTLIATAGGKTNLLQIVTDRFIQRTNLIKSFSLLDRALKVCAEARLHISNRIKAIDERDSKIRGIISELLPLQTQSLPAIEAAITMMQTLAQEMKFDLELLKNVLLNLDQQTLNLQTHFKDIEEDVNQLQILDSASTGLSETDLYELRCLLGCYGQSAEERLSYYLKETGIDIMGTLDQRIDFWGRKKETAHRSYSPVFAHAVNRLEALADYFERKETS